MVKGSLPHPHPGLPPEGGRSRVCRLPPEREGTRVMRYGEWETVRLLCWWNTEVLADLAREVIDNLVMPGKRRALVQGRVVPPGVPPAFAQQLTSMR